ncbi:AMP-binding protein [Paracoccus sp. 11-3]|uniref:AMP-binding protein n=1 Tax=Paracoccus amoyensis TaxID=2760093 RepID=A0A926GJN5_9RHOB|nr:AMP-binding protein [Paracoccus amoyensis]MBC9245255.1 AMP-binding protein [Paracoccus amoyensis]
MDSLLGVFAKTVDRHPDRVAIIDGKGRKVTFAALMSRINSLAAAWQRQGIGAGDRVLMAMPLGSDLYASLAALWSLGATVVLPEPAMGIAGVRHAVHTAGVTAFCASGGYRVLRMLLPRLWLTRQLRLTDTRGAFVPVVTSKTDIALISFTSGSSGKPKAIPRSHGFLLAQHKALAPLLDSASDERDLVAFPVFALLNLAAGRTSILPDWKMSNLAELTPEQLHNWIARQGATRALLPPSLCQKLGGIALPPRLHSIFTGGGPVFPDMIARLQTTNPRLNVTCVYGSTEAEPIAILDTATVTADDHQAMLAGAGLLAGPPVAGLQLRIMNDEIQGAGPHVNEGYLDPADNAQNKIRVDETIWHRTGDAGRLDSQGRLWLWGRTGTQVTIAEGQVYPFVIEVAAHQWPGVQQCALMYMATKPVLVIEGDRTAFAIWQENAQTLGIHHLHHMTRIPMDRRHASKIDRKALARVLAKHLAKTR